MEQRKYNDPIKKPEIQDMIMGYHIGCTVASVADRLNSNPTEVLMQFYDSKLCAQLHNKNTGVYYYSSLAIADDFIKEIGGEKL